MNKFGNNKGSGRRESSRRNSGEREEGKKSNSYKAKRSFTKNKSFRDIKKSEGSGSGFGYKDDRKPFKKSFSKASSAERNERPRKAFKEDGPVKRYSSDKDRFSDKKERGRDSYDSKPSYGKDQYASRSKKNWDSNNEHPSDRDKPRRSYDRDDTKKPADKRKKSYDSDDHEKSYGKDKYSDRPRKSWETDTDTSSNSDRPKRSYDRDEKKSSEKRDWKPKEDKFDGFKRAHSKHGFKESDKSGGGEKKRRLTKPRKNHSEDSDRRVKFGDFEEGRSFSKRDYKNKDSKPGKTSKTPTNSDGLIRLNKYLSNAGIASRREADNLILSGAVKVNGQVVDQLGFKIKPTDTVSYGDAKVKTERKVYLLLNKPKDYITTTDDPRERKTVMELIQGACRERIYPVGRLDRNTTGLLLFTNDGELTTKLTHPKHGIKKVYHVSLNKGLKTDDFKAIVQGIELEDGPIKADDLAFVGEGKKEIGIEIHSGRNRIVRRIFEHLGYDVIKLDRVVFAGLTKKDLPRGKHRFLTQKEVSFLQMIG
ncbi:MAG: pseudouridine synthase [Bacteroidia bacterium]|nr:pseudouridine synthase [Bacteroidia bacterium]